MIALWRNWVLGVPRLVPTVSWDRRPRFPAWRALLLFIWFWCHDHLFLIQSGLRPGLIIALFPVFVHLFRVKLFINISIFTMPFLDDATEIVTDHFPRLFLTSQSAHSDPELVWRWEEFHLVHELCDNGTFVSHGTSSCRQTCVFHNALSAKHSHHGADLITELHSHASLVVNIHNQNNPSPGIMEAERRINMESRTIPSTQRAAQGTDGSEPRPPFSREPQISVFSACRSFLWTSQRLETSIHTSP